MTPHVMSVLCATSRRPAHWLPRAIANWQAGDYQNRSLLIVDGYPGAAPRRGEHVRDRIPSDPRISYMWSRAKTLGEKYNDGCRRAPDDAWIGFASDDDWSHPGRISKTVDYMVRNEVDIGGSVSMVGYRERDAACFLYAHPYALEPREAEDGDEPGMQRIAHTDAFLVGATVIVAKRRWQWCKFPAMQSGSDSVWIRRLLMQGDADGTEITTRAAIGDDHALVTTTRNGNDLRFIQINDPRSYVAFVHGANTGNSLDGIEGGMTWSRVDELDLSRLMGAEDAARFGVARRAA